MTTDAWGNPLSNDQFESTTDYNKRMASRVPQYGANLNRTDWSHVLSDAYQNSNDTQFGWETLYDPTSKRIDTNSTGWKSLLQQLKPYTGKYGGVYRHGKTDPESAYALMTLGVKDPSKAYQLMGNNMTAAQDLHLANQGVVDHAGQGDFERSLFGAAEIGSVALPAFFTGGAAAGAMGGGLGGTMAGGAVGGATGAAFSGQDPLKGALLGGAMGGIGYGANQLMGGTGIPGFGGSPTEGGSQVAGSGSGSMTGTPGSFDVASAGMSDVPQGYFSETGNQLAQVTEGGTGDYDWLSDMSGDTTLSTRSLSDPNLMGIPIDGSYLDGSSLSGDTTQEEMPQDSTLFGEESLVESDPTMVEGTSFDSGMDFSAGGEIPVEQQYPGMDVSTMDKLKQAYAMMKDPLALAGAMGKMYMGRNQADEMRKYLESQKAGEFNHREFDQLARNYKDPNMRKQMLENTPGYAMSRDYLLKEQMRKLAQQGKFGQIGQGDAMASNWAVPMADVVGKNAMNWDNQIFGQVKDLTGMGENNSAANAGLAGAFLPKAASQENQGWMDLLEAMRRNQGFLPDFLKTQLA